MTAAARSSRTQIRRNLRTKVPRPALAGDRRLSLIVPAYREVDQIGETVIRIRDELGSELAAGELEIVVVDDGSDDATAEAASIAGADRVVALGANRGKGGAIRAGVEVASGRVMAFTDADLAYSPAQVLRILQEVEEGWDIAIGSRRHPDADAVVAPGFVREVGSRAINAATRLVLVGGYVDTQCGLKGFRSDVGRLLFGLGKVDGFAFDIELLALAELHGFSVAEVPVSLESSDTSTVNVARDALDLLVDMVRIRRWTREGVYDLTAEELGHLTVGDDG